MEENKVELTEKEEKRRNLINYFLEKNPVLESDTKLKINNSEPKKWRTDDKLIQNSGSKDDSKKSWWYDGKIFNQQAHVIMNILSNSPYAVSNKGYRLWFILASKNKDDIKDGIIDNGILKSKIIEKLKDDNERKEFLKKNESNINFNNPKVIELTIEKNFNLCNIIDDKFKYNLPANKLNILLDFVELYFKDPSNFTINYSKTKLDYPNLNEPILNNLYKWYLKEITSTDELDKYHTKLETIIKNMNNLLEDKEISNIQKCNLICTIAKTKTIIDSKSNIKKELDKLEFLLEKLVEKYKTNYNSIANEFMKEYEKSSH